MKAELYIKRKDRVHFQFLDGKDMLQFSLLI